MSTDRTQPGAWETWKWDGHALRSVHGEYLGLVGNNLAALPTPSNFTRIEIDPPPAPLSRLHISGRYFFNELNQKVLIKGTTDFMLYKYHLENVDIDPILAERAAHGCNCVRVIGMVSWFDYTPQKYGVRYYDEIPAFLKRCAAHGLYVYFTVFADTQVVMPKLADQLAHWERLKQLFDLLELVNEPYTGTNATANPLAFTRPNGVPASSGSYNDKYGGQVTPPPYWDFHDFHVPRKDGKRVADQCMVTHPNYIQKGQAILSGEPDKFGGPNIHNPQVYLNDPDLSRQMYQTAKGTACGYVYHTSAGNFSLLWNDVEKQCCPFLMGD